ncbi:MAG: response regulator [Lysobacter sp.]
MSAALDPLDATPVDATPEADAAPRWRILMVEDCADDAELACIALADAGLHVDCRCVDSEAALLEALRTFAPHLVLSDQHLPGFSGARALELVRSLAPSVRFVVVSGAPEPGQAALPPDAPVADAWLLKDDLTQLPALVQRLLAGSRP